jgi:hypothetical protein
MEAATGEMETTAGEMEQKAMSKFDNDLTKKFFRTP